MPYIVKKAKPLPKGHFIVEQRATRLFLGSSGDCFNEPDNIIDHFADILFIPEEEEEAFLAGDVDRTKYRIGYVKYCIVQVGRMANGYGNSDFMEACDDHSAELAQVATSLFDESGSFKTDVVDELLCSGDFMYVDAIRLDPAWRGWGIGLLALDGVIALQPSFVQDAILLNPAGLASETPDDAAAHEKAQQKLISYYSLMGFSRFSKPEEKFVIFGLCTSYVRPRIETVVPHFFPEQ